jgi:hypothetical protein
MLVDVLYYALYIKFGTWPGTSKRRFFCRICLKSYVSLWYFIDKKKIELTIGGIKRNVRDRYGHLTMFLPAPLGIWQRVSPAPSEIWPYFFLKVKFRGAPPGDDRSWNWLVHNLILQHFENIENSCWTSIRSWAVVWKVPRKSILWHPLGNRFSVVQCIYITIDAQLLACEQALFEIWERACRPS